MGSGTTLIAARGANRRTVGYDIDPEYVQLAASRLAELGTSKVLGGLAARPGD